MLMFMHKLRFIVGLRFALPTLMTFLDNLLALSQLFGRQGAG